MTQQNAPRSPTSQRPSLGDAPPQQVHISLALKAIDESRWSDATRHVAAIPESPLSAYAWKLYLDGWLAAERLDFPSAEAALLPAVSAALVTGFGDEKRVAAEFILLAAAGLDKLGLIYRRQERLDDAYRAHRAAFCLYEEYGSWDERWEAAMNLTVDCAVAQRDDEAHRWCRTAIDLATLGSEHTSAHQAQSWSRLSTVLTSLGQHEDAVAAARTSRDCWRKLDLSAVSAARADVDLAGALIKNAEFLYDTEAARARSLLKEAVEFLTTAADELPPFGVETAADLRRCMEQTDFATRLLASLNG